MTVSQFTAGRNVFKKRQNFRFLLGGEFFGVYVAFCNRRRGERRRFISVCFHKVVHALRIVFHPFFACFKRGEKRVHKRSVGSKARLHENTGLRISFFARNFFVFRLQIHLRVKPELHFESRCRGLAHDRKVNAVFFFDSGFCKVAVRDVLHEYVLACQFFFFFNDFDIIHFQNISENQAPVHPADRCKRFFYL